MKLEIDRDDNAHQKDFSLFITECLFKTKPKSLDKIDEMRRGNEIQLGTSIEK